MFLFPRKQLLVPQVLSPGGTALLGTTVNVEIDTSQPLEEIAVVISGTVNAAISGVVSTNPDFLLTILKRVRLILQDGGKPRPIVDYSGVGLLELAAHTGMNLDRATLGAVRVCQANSLAASLQFQITYRIPLVHPMLGEPFRTMCLLPVHLLTQTPILSLEFDSAANMFTTGSLTSVSAEVLLLKRDISVDQNKAIADKGGFLQWDLMESAQAVPIGYAGPEFKFDIATSGSYLGLMIRDYLGGATITRGPIDKTTTFGAETRWRIESGGNVKTEFRAKHMQIINDWSRPANGLTSMTATLANALFAALTSAGSPTVRFDPSANFGGVIAANALFQPAGSFNMDFLTDGLGAEGANEFGSVLDCNVIAGQKVQLIGEVSNVATNASVRYIGGHRIYGDLTPWQKM